MLLIRIVCQQFIKQFFPRSMLLSTLLRNSANPFIHDKDGATLIRYGIQTTCNQTIKTLLLYNVDINRPDDHGWTPLHLAVQTQRTDFMKILLIKGADGTLKTQNGLTPLELCLRLGHHARTYELIKLRKCFCTKATRLSLALRRCMALSKSLKFIRRA